MKKNIVYRYNPETDNYERYYPSATRRLRTVAIYLAVGIAVGICLFLSVFYFFDSPTEKNLRRENAQLKSQFDILRGRLDNSIKVMENIRERDDNFYRVMMQMEPVSRSRMYAGLANENRYKHLAKLPESGLITELTGGMDMLDRQLYTQSQSFDDLKSAALKQKDRLAHIPSVLPLNIKDYTLASGYGPRIDPVYGASAFHEGLDFAAEEGTGIFATAAGRVVQAGWRGGYGNCVEVEHGYNYVTRYGHMSSIAVREGEYVERGEKLGEVGSTGKSTGPHLHYEVRFKGEPQNPVNYYFMDITPAQYDEMIRRADNAGHVMD